jgi:hypothetical protein
MCGMEENKSQVFSGITAAKFQKLIEMANAAGVDITGNSGRANKMGIEIEWNYSEQEQQLELTCLHTPFFVSMDSVNTKLRDMVNQALA